MAKTLLLLGGGHAHLSIIRSIPACLRRGHRVVVVGPSDYHYYSGMGPGMLGGTYAPEQIRFPVRSMVEEAGGTFVKAMATRILASERRVLLDNGVSLTYDVLSCNTGSRVPDGMDEDDSQVVFPVKPIENLFRARERLASLLCRNDVRVTVVGGGPAAVEVAGNVWRLARDLRRSRARIVVHAGRALLGRYPWRVRELARASLEGRGIRVRAEGRVRSVRQGVLRLADGRTEETDLVLLATGVEPSPLFRDSGLPVARDGGLLVNRCLQSTEHETILGGGDCVHFTPEPLRKVGVQALRQSPLLLHNTLALLEGEPLRAFRPRSGHLLIFNLGDGNGLFWKGRLIFEGRLPFLLKDWIDRRFMRRFLPS